MQCLATLSLLLSASLTSQTVSFFSMTSPKAEDVLVALSKKYQCSQNVILADEVLNSAICSLRKRVPQYHWESLGQGDLFNQ